MLWLRRHEWASDAQSSDIALAGARLAMSHRRGIPEAPERLQSDLNQQAARSNPVALGPCDRSPAHGEAKALCQPALKTSQEFSAKILFERETFSAFGGHYFGRSV